MPGRLVVCRYAGVGVSALGTLTESASPDAATVYKQSRRRRYNLQKTAAQLLPGERVETCGWRPIQGQQLGISRRAGKHYVSHAAVCGSVWVCPVCAAKIASQRSQELEQAVRAWSAQGGVVWMLTLTINHTAQDALPALLGRFTKAMSQLWAGKWGKSWRADNGQVGMVRNLEVTWGLANGWHPHCHALLFVSADACPITAEETIKHHWQSVASRYGFSVSLRRGAVIDAPLDDDIAALLAKYAGKIDKNLTWGFPQELTWANIKSARGQRFTPFSLLSACDSDDVGAAPALFQAYADAFKGRRQLYWSKNLRALLALEPERSDEDVAHAQDDQAVFVAAVATDIFCWIKARGQLCDLLEAADDYGVEGIESYLEWAYDCRTLEAADRRRGLNAA